MLWGKAFQAEHNLTHSAGCQDPEPGMETESLDRKVREEATEEDAEAAPDNGAEGHPGSRIYFRILVLKVKLGVHWPGGSTFWHEIGDNKIKLF